MLYIIAFACFFYSIFYMVLLWIFFSPEVKEPHVLFNIINFYIPGLVFKGLLKVHTYICIIILIKILLEPKKIKKRLFCLAYIVLALVPLISFEFPLISNFLDNYVKSLGYIYIPFLIASCVFLYIHKQIAKKNNEELFY